ncbi:MAG: hypothetical protein ABIS51_10175 [Sphingomonas sp.]
MAAVMQSRLRARAMISFGGTAKDLAAGLGAIETGSAALMASAVSAETCLSFVGSAGANSAISNFGCAGRCFPVGSMPGARPSPSATKTATPISEKSKTIAIAKARIGPSLRRDFQRAAGLRGTKVVFTTTRLDSHHDEMRQTATA